MIRRDESRGDTRQFRSRLRVGDPVMVVAGGNSQRNRILKGQTGKLLRFLPKQERAIVEGINVVKRHKRATQAGDAAGIIEKEASVHVSNLMYYVEALGRPVRLKAKTLGDGTKVRGYLHPETKDFEQIDS